MRAVQQAALSHPMLLVQALGKSGVLKPAIKDGERFDFCMCNPPFFENAKLANQNPDTACGGAIILSLMPILQISKLTCVTVPHCVTNTGTPIKTG
jgi:23S rRNA A1618 N6-methylase RlmF